MSNFGIMTTIETVPVSQPVTLESLVEKIKNLLSEKPMDSTQIYSALENEVKEYLYSLDANVFENTNVRRLSYILKKIDGVVYDKKTKKYSLFSDPVKSVEETPAVEAIPSTEELLSRIDNEELRNQLMKSLGIKPVITPVFTPVQKYVDVTAELDSTTAKAEKAKAKQENIRQEKSKKSNKKGVKDDTKLKKVDMFKSKKSLAEITREFFICYLKKTEILEKTNSNIIGLRNYLKTLEHIQQYEYDYTSINGQKVKVYGTSRWTEDELLEKIEKQKHDIMIHEDEQSKMMADISKHTDNNRWDGRWVWNFLDSTTITAINQAEDWDDVKKAIKSWCGAYDLDISNTNLENDLMKATDWHQSQRKLAKTNGTDPMEYNGRKSLENYYGVIFKYAVLAGTIRPVDIPLIVRDKYNKNRFKK